jgi:hypothetical protein
MASESVSMCPASLRRARLLLMIPPAISRTIRVRLKARIRRSFFSRSMRIDFICGRLNRKEKSLLTMIFDRKDGIGRMDGTDRYQPANIC